MRREAREAIRAERITDEQEKKRQRAYLRQQRLYHRLRLATDFCQRAKRLFWKRLWQKAFAVYALRTERVQHLLLVKHPDRMMRKPWPRLAYREPAREQRRRRYLRYGDHRP